MNKEFIKAFGRVYGSRISLKGNHLNLEVISEIEGKQYLIAIPILLKQYADEGYKKPVAVNVDDSRYSILNVMYYNSLPKRESNDEIESDDLPF